MGKDSAIEWCHHTFNLWWGCVEQSLECDHCYAREWAKRCGFSVWGKVDAVDRRWFQPEHYEQLGVWDRAAAQAGERHRVFCSSMMDIGEIGHPRFDEERERFFAWVERCPNLDFLLLTKLPQNFTRILPRSWQENPRRNVVGMTTVGCETSMWRLGHLLAAPFMRRGVSMEPLLERIPEQDLRRHLSPKRFSGRHVRLGPANQWILDVDVTHLLWRGLDWVIVGGESGGKARPMRAEWVRAIRDACAEAEVPFFFKQWGAWLGETSDGAKPSGKRVSQVLNATGEPIWVGKKAAGNFLDGRQHLEFYAPVEVAA